MADPRKTEAPVSEGLLAAARGERVSAVPHRRGSVGDTLRVAGVQSVPAALAVAAARRLAHGRAPADLSLALIALHNVREHNVVRTQRLNTKSCLSGRLLVNAHLVPPASGGLLTGGTL